ncbi:MAG: sigma-70 family RNA polymerase sigma factor [Deltaproteobacteria bacterium]|nr:sigma-70 family RNA polymerase sigma factor [Deltaproteobacteria bacterium]
MSTLPPHVSDSHGVSAAGLFVPENDPWYALAQAARAGDQRATTQLLECVAPSMLHVIRKMVSTDIEDLLQDALLAFLNALPRFRHTASTRHFACRVAVLTCMAYRRKQRPWYQRLWSDATVLDQLPGQEPLPSDALSTKQQEQAVRRLVERLPAAQAEVLLMHVVAELSLPEVAATLQIPLETARSRLRLALTRLRKKLNVGEQRIEDWLANA